MSRIIKLLDNENIEIVEYRKANACFQTNEYANDELFCIIRETFNPFDIFQKNLGLETENRKLWKRHNEEYKQICNAIEYIKKHQRKDGFLNLNEWETRDLLNILNKGSDLT